MRILRPTVLAALAALSIPGALFAQGVRYVVTGTFPAGTPTTKFTGPGVTFTMTFLAPNGFANPANLNKPVVATGPVLTGSYDFKGIVTDLTAGSITEDDSNAAAPVNTTTLRDATGFTVSYASNDLNGAPSLIGTPDPDGVSHYVAGPFGNRTVAFAVGTPPNTTTVPAVPASFVGTPIPGTVFDVLGHYGPDAPVTKYSAPNAGFFLEFGIQDQPPRPGPFTDALLYATFAIGGKNYNALIPASFFSHSGSHDSVFLTFPDATVELYTLLPAHVPLLVSRAGLTVSFPVGDLGAGTNWLIYGAPTGGVAFNVGATLPDFISRRF